MIYIIAFIIATYALARLLQVPWENFDATTSAEKHRKHAALTTVSVLGVLVIGFLTYITWKSATDVEARSNQRNPVSDYSR